MQGPSEILAPPRSNSTSIFILRRITQMFINFKINLKMNALKLLATSKIDASPFFMVPYKLMKTTAICEQEELRGHP